MTVQDVSRLISALLPEPHAGLLAGILFGVKAELSRELYDVLVTSGTLHIVALSGMNITILTGLVSLALLPLVGRRIAGLLAAIFTIGFIWFVGPSPSIVRAGMMGCLSLVAVVFGRQIWAFWFWVIAVAIMLAVQPTNIIEVSFQLSALATLGLILFGSEQSEPPRLTTIPRPGSRAIAFLSPAWRAVWTDLRVTLAAQVFTIPVLFFHFHRISLIAPLSNLLIGWVIAPLTVLGLATVVAGLIWLPAGQVLAWVSWVPLSYVLAMVNLTGRIPFASIGW